MSRVDVENSKVHIEKILLVCSSCGKETEDGNTSKNLQRNVQLAAKDKGERILVLLTSCLGVCPDQGTTIGYTSAASRITLEVVADDIPTDMIALKL